MFALLLFCSAVQLLDTVAWLISRLRDQLPLVEHCAGPSLETAGSLAARIGTPLGAALGRGYAALQQPVNKGCGDVVDLLIKRQVRHECHELARASRVSRASRASRVQRRG